MKTPAHLIHTHFSAHGKRYSTSSRDIIGIRIIDGDQFELFLDNGNRLQVPANFLITSVNDQTL